MPNIDRSQYENLPIPTYEEAVSSHPASSRTGPSEISNDAERQGLLHQQDETAYRAPTVESARSSLDSLDGLDSGPSSPAQRRREMEQMDIEDPLNSDSSSSTNSLLRRGFAKNFSWTTSFRVPSLKLPSWRYFIPTISFPRINYESIDSHRAIIIGRLFGIFVILGLVYA
ncbi:uncharacterized protein AB675_8510 [Cyphellophora attinorum]|uniref:Uncharacterized protein n=1 Tax=Cyphellophora attinorum TaxID=1664694 RepID=A0A0N1HFJ7_9EURO|nr:uncharacterized protein AB675_8510 [Phialophora attinorum]KPI44547.1 hypothetical protein AB675_8510 [Phialophora attinorum]